MIRSRILFLSIIILSLFSCGEETHEVWVNSNGSGKFVHTTEMWDMMPTFELIFGSNPSNTGLGFHMRLFKENELIDTTITFKALIIEELLKDVLPDEELKLLEEEGLKALAKSKGNEFIFQDEQLQTAVDDLMNVKININVDPEKKHYLNSMMQDFSSLDKILTVNLIEIYFASIADTSGMSLEQIKNFKNELYKIYPSFQLNKKQLTIHKEKITTSNLSKDIQMFNELIVNYIGNKNYKLVVHVPGKVKKVSHPNASFKRNIVQLEMKMSEFMDYENSWDIVIDFKPDSKIKY